MSEQPEETPVKRGRGRPKKERPNEIIPVKEYEFPEFDTWRVGEIIRECEKSSDQEQIVAFLQKHMSVQLADILRMVYDPAIRMRVNEDLPTRNPINPGHLPLFRAYRNLDIVMRNNTTDKIDPAIIKRSVYKMLEEVVYEDFDTLRLILGNKTFPSITQRTAEKATGMKF